MSHLLDCKTQIHDKAALLEALKTMGFKDIEIHENPVPLKGYHDYADNKKANIVVKDTGIKSHVGFLKGNDGFYTAQIDDFNYGTGKVYDQKFVCKVTQNYNVAVTERGLKERGIKYQRTVSNGRIQLKCEFEDTVQEKSRLTSRL